MKSWNVRICVVVTGNTLSKFLENLREAESKSDFVELRADHINSLKESDIEKIRKAVTKTAIFTCRRKDEGGLYEGSEPERNKIIRKALELDFEYVDIELKTVKTSIFTPKNSKIIVSYHNFEVTPSYQTLNSIANDMRENGADIIKIATMAKHDDDNNKLFKLLMNKKLSEEMIIVGMGEKGKLTRIMSPLMGGFLTFANIKGQSTAPGQIDKDVLESTYDDLLG